MTNVTGDWTKTCEKGKEGTQRSEIPQITRCQELPDCSALDRRKRGGMPVSSMGLRQQWSNGKVCTSVPDSDL